jgi:hypothetical protein
LKLLDEFGSHEMLGWFSSLILRTEIMITGLKNANEGFQVDGLMTSASTFDRIFEAVERQNSSVYRLSVV